MKAWMKHEAENELYCNSDNKKKMMADRAAFHNDGWKGYVWVVDVPSDLAGVYTIAGMT